MSVSKRPCSQSTNNSNAVDRILLDRLNFIIEKGICKLIGNTPLLDLSHLVDNPKIRLFAKAEFMNPGGSVKDRAALNIIKNAIESGNLTQEKILLDSTSGNTGIAYAMICSALGVRLTICLPKNASKERQQLLKSYGAKLVLTDPLEGTDGAYEVALELSKKRPEIYYYANQYDNDCNWQAHFNSTGPEIIRQTDKKITHFVAGLGTTGTFGGIARKLKEFNSEIQTISFQPDSPFHGLEGLKHLETAKTPGIYDNRLVDENLSVTTSKAYQMTKQLASNEGILVGISSGAAIVASLELASRLTEGLIVTILPDRGERYLSENVWRG